METETAIEELQQVQMGFLKVLLGVPVHTKTSYIYGRVWQTPPAGDMAVASCPINEAA